MNAIVLTGEAKVSVPPKARHLLPPPSPSLPGEAAIPVPVKAGRCMPRRATPTSPTKGSRKRCKAEDDLHENAMAPVPHNAPSGSTGQLARAISASDALPVESPTIASLRELGSQRRALHSAEKKLTNQMKAICRRYVGGDRDEGNKLFARCLDDQNTEEIAVVLEPYFIAQSVIEGRRKAKEKEMETIAKALPAVAFVKRISGFGIGSLAAIVGEAGDLSNYPTHSKLWKRLGLSPYKGKAPASWRKGGASTEDWIEMGYSPLRRAMVWNIGACVMKAQSARVDKETGEILKPAGPYRVMYDDRKALELSKGCTLGHAHNRAQRYIEKHIIRQLWKFWRA